MILGYHYLLIFCVIMFLFIVIYVCLCYFKQEKTTRKHEQGYISMKWITQNNTQRKIQYSSVFPLTKEIFFD